MTERTANNHMEQAAIERARWVAVLGTSTVKRAQCAPRSLFARLFGL